MIIRITARRIAAIKPQHGIVDGPSVVIAAEVSTRDMVGIMKAIAQAMPHEQWQNTINDIEQEEVAI